MFYASNNINKSNSAFSNHQYRKTCLGLVAQAPILLPGLYIVGSTHLSPPLPKKKKKKKLKVMLEFVSELDSLEALDT